MNKEVDAAFELLKAAIIRNNYSALVVETYMGLTPLQIASKTAKGLGAGLQLGTKIIDNNNANNLAKLEEKAKTQTALKLTPPVLQMPQNPQLVSDHPLYTSIFGEDNAMSMNKNKKKVKL